MSNNNSGEKNNELNVVIPKKRGRKSKKDILEQELKAQLENKSAENINVIIEEINIINECQNYDMNKLINATNNISNQISDIKLNDINGLNDISDINENDIIGLNVESIEDKPVTKKRGRKPKGGKIIQQVVPLNINKETRPNVILHLKCSLKDLHQNALIDPDINGFDFVGSNQLKYDSLNKETNIFNNNNANNFALNEIQEQYKSEDEYEDDHKDNDIREVWKKLKVLEHNLHVNNICDKKSACFWCTYDFDNPHVYIPKHHIKESYHVYGCFCSPECATAYLMEENIDSSSKFERYYLINHIYSKIYNYKKNIKPAPNPFYMLEKYYGNLTIQEYRSLLRNERLFLIVDKPLTRIMPELHEDNDDFIINNKVIPSNTYQLKKKFQKKQSKNNILSERFGLLQQ
jgi:hypothetical protein